MKQNYLFVLVLILNLTLGYSNDCAEDDSLTEMIGTTVRTNELDEETTEHTTVTDEDTTEVTTVTDEDTTEVTTVTDEDTTEVTTVTDEDTTELTTIEDEDTTELTTEKPTTLPATTTPPVTVPNNPCETTTTCATTKKSTDELSPSIQYYIKSSDCLTQKSGTVLVDANHCRRYYMCSSGKTIRYRCPTGNWYDRKKLTCRLRSQVSNCPANRN